MDVMVQVKDNQEIANEINQTLKKEKVREKQKTPPEITV